MNPMPNKKPKKTQKQIPKRRENEALCGFWFGTVLHATAKIEQKVERKV